MEFPGPSSIRETFANEKGDSHGNGLTASAVNPIREQALLRRLISQSEKAALDAAAR